MSLIVDGATVTIIRGDHPERLHSARQPMLQELRDVKPLEIVTVILAATLSMAGCSPIQAGGPVPKRAGTAASQTRTVAEALGQTGYHAAPMRRDRDLRFIEAKIAATPASLLLSSGSPFDLLLDSTLALGQQSGVYGTDVLSAYWTGTSAERHYWAVVDRLTVGGTVLQTLEAKMEPSPVPGAQALLGATALMSRGAIVDYATDSLYLLAPRGPTAPVRQTQEKQPSLRAALERAGHYRTFLDLMKRAGLIGLLEGTPGESTAGRVTKADSVAWLGLRIQAARLSGVAAMPPNDVHLQLTRAALDRRLRRRGRHTAFIPTDAAFARLPAELHRAWLADTARLARLLRAHLFPGVAIDTTAMRAFIRGVAQPGPDHAAFGFHVLGPQIDIDRLTSWEEGRVVARATVVEPDLRAANGIAHGIDRVLIPDTTQPRLAAALARQGYVGIPLYRSEDGNGYLVHAMVNDSAVPLLIDTGTPRAVVLDQRRAARLRLTGGTDKDIVAFDSVRLGPTHIDTADFSSAMQWSARLGYRTAAGVVGSLLLARYDAVIDYADGMLYLRIPAASTPAGSGSGSATP